MKELFRKELREHVKVTLLGLLIFAVLLVHAYQASTEVLSRLLQNSFGQSDALQPLLTSTLLSESGFFCGIFGALLGWLQIRAEKHRDLWAFLIHRPMARTRILLAKVLAGLCLYFLAVGVPMTVLVAVVATPGHIAAPFKWAMVLPLLGLFLAGIPCYFAGMLTGLRQARWYASRGLGLAAAAVAVFAVTRSAEFWQILVVTATIGAALAVAVRGSFQSGGYYRGQRTPGRVALSASLFVGAAVVIGVVISLLTSLALQPFSQSSTEYTSYSMTANGNIWKVNHYRNGEQEVTDLDGRPVNDPETGHPLSWRQLSKQLPPSSYATARSSQQVSYYYDQYSRSGHFFSLWSMAGRELWYFTRQGRLAGYNGMSRRLIGTLQPPADAAENRFLLPQNYASYFNSFDPPRTLASKSVLYNVDLAQKELHALLAVTNGNSILASVDTAENATLVMTRNFVELVDQDGAQIWQLPFTDWYPKYNGVTVYFLKEPGTYAAWLSPSYAANKKSGWKLPTHVMWIAGGSGVLTQANKTLDLPPLPRPQYSDLVGKITSLIVPPVLLIPTTLATHQFPPLWAWLCLIPALASAAVGWWLCRRYHFSFGARVSWGIFHLLGGVPGLLAFLSVQEWPAREPCPRCSRLRTVDRRHCEHCGAEFSPPAKNGTEIFVALESNHLPVAESAGR